MSRADLFAFVEGWSDRYFYDKICDLACRGTGLTFDVRTAQELPTNTGGKATLLAFFSYLRRRKLLLQEFKGKKLAVIFFLDKDVDDIVGVRRRSKYVIYTEYYEFENYLIRYTDVSEVAAAAASLDVGSLRQILGDQPQWMLRAATEWKQWVILCVTARRLEANCGCTYSLQSQINAGPYGGVVAADLANFTTVVQTACGLPTTQSDPIMQRIIRRVDRIYATGRHDQVFKGKWYTRFLAEDVHNAAAGRPYNVNGLEARILAIAGAKLDFEQAWTAYFRLRILSVIRALQA